MSEAEGRQQSGIRWRSYGRGQPVTLVVPGLAATPGEARVPAGGLAGTRVVLTLPGHPGPDGHTVAAPAGFWHYSYLASEMSAVVDRLDATVAIGTSLGAEVLLRMLAESAERGHSTPLRAVGLLLPAAFDEVRETGSALALGTLAEAVAAHDRQRLQELVAGGLPENARSGDYVQQRVSALMDLLPALQQLPQQVPVLQPEVLSRLDLRSLVLAAEGDPLHPAATAQRVAEALPGAQLLRPESAAPLITHRRQLRSALAGL